MKPTIKPLTQRPAWKALAPTDIEYLCCECRKYYSYINGTKKFEGENLFIPKSATT